MRNLRTAFVTFILAALMATALAGCAGQQAEESQPEGALTMDAVTADDLNDAFYLMATALSPDSAMESVYIVGDPDAKEVRATFTTEADGTDARPLADEAEALCAQYSLAVAQAALQRAQDADEPDEEAIQQWQAIVAAEQENVDAGEGAGALYDTYAIVAVIQNADASVTFDGERDAGADQEWRWQ